MIFGKGKTDLLPSYPDYFSAKEKEGLSIGLIDKLNMARQRAGIPFKLNSGKRTKAQNKKAGGVKDSAHLKGLAVDIRARTSKARFKIVKALLEVGFKRIGIGKTFVHADLDKKKAQVVIWLYN